MERVTFLGHATVLAEVGGARLLTDPLLRARLAHLRRHGRPIRFDHVEQLDAVLISHLHRDHFDRASLKLLDRATPIVVPRGAGTLAGRAGFRQVVEIAEGESLRLQSATVRAVFADHDDHRGRVGGLRVAPLGFVLEGATTTYFAGDTDLFDGMAELAPGLDLALLPVWGWGPSIGPGHMGPAEAARAAELLRPRLAVPIHWGTYYPRGLHRVRPLPLHDPPHRFAREVAATAPAVDVRVLQPGEALEICR